MCVPMADDCMEMFLFFFCFPLWYYHHPQGHQNVAKFNPKYRLRLHMINAETETQMPYNVYMRICLCEELHPNRLKFTGLCWRMKKINNNIVINNWTAEKQLALQCRCVAISHLVWFSDRPSLWHYKIKLYQLPSNSIFCHSSISAFVYSVCVVRTCKSITNMINALYTLINYTRTNTHVTMDIYDWTYSNNFHVAFSGLASMLKVKSNSFI